jgi:hypothetical protein
MKVFNREDLYNETQKNFEEVKEKTGCTCKLKINPIDETYSKSITKAVNCPVHSSGSRIVHRM